MDFFAMQSGTVNENMNLDNVFFLNYFTIKEKSCNKNIFWSVIPRTWTKELWATVAIYIITLSQQYKKWLLYKFFQADKNFKECSQWIRGEFLRTEVNSTYKNKWIIFGKQWEDRSDQLSWSKHPRATTKFTRENTDKNLRNSIYKTNGRYWK